MHVLTPPHLVHICKLPATRLAAMATQQAKHNQQSESSSGPMKTGVPVVMVKEAFSPQLLQYSSKKNTVLLMQIQIRELGI